MIDLSTISLIGVGVHVSEQIKFGYIILEFKFVNI